MARNNNSDGIGTGWILPVGILLVGYFGIIKPITDKLGITKSGKDKEEEKENEAASKSDGWNPTFYKTYMTSNPGKTFCLKRSADLDALAKQIYNAWGILNDDENAIFAALRQLRSQLQLSQLCERYQTLYKTDLLTRIKNPWFKGNDGLEPNELIEVSKIVNALPVNVTTC